MSTARIVILFLGMVAILLLGTWGWSEALNAVNNNPDSGPVLEALAVYGIAICLLIVSIGFPYLVLRYVKQ